MAGEGQSENHSVAQAMLTVLSTSDSTGGSMPLPYYYSKGICYTVYVETE